MTIKGRFAPSPSGRMHLGNLFSALLAWLDVRAQGGSMLLRIEDLDPDRCRAEYAHQLMDDLRWLGLDWDEGPYWQSQRTGFYRSQFERLDAQGLLYPCFCTRADRLAAAAPHPGEEQPGTGHCPCYYLTQRARAARALTRAPAWKVAAPEETICFQDGLFGPRSEHLAQGCGDFILRRSDGVYAYQLAVTADDGAMGVNRVVRGRDLLDSTPRQIWLMDKLGYLAPSYLHVPLLVAPDGRRLSKRERDMDVGVLREKMTPEAVVGWLAVLAGLRAKNEKISAAELIFAFSTQKINNSDKVIN